MPIRATTESAICAMLSSRFTLWAISQIQIVFYRRMRNLERGVEMSGKIDKIDPRLIKHIGDKDFVIFEGLLDVAHQEGLCLVDTEVKQFPDDGNDHTAVVRAVVKTDKGTFSGTGDANSKNVNSMIAPHIIRMAETRAVARALRFACNIGITSLEELGDIHEGDNQHIPNRKRSEERKDTNNRVTENQKRAIVKMIRQMGVSEEQVEPLIKEKYGAALGDLSYDQCGSIIKKLTKEVNGKTR